MKKIFLIVLAVVAVISLCQPDLSAEGTASTKIIAYYFHGSFRCVTCTNMEKYSKEAIETYFKEDIDAGKIVFMTVNVEEKKNEHFAKDYQLYTKSLILSLQKDGKEVKSKNLDKIWPLASNKQRFSEYVINEMAAFMEGAL